MLRLRAALIALVLIALGLGAIALLAPFLAPGWSYNATERVAEWTSGRGERPFRIALGSTTGTYYRLGTILNKYLKEKSGYELELVATGGVPENVRAILDPAHPIDLAMVDSASDEAAKARDLVALATVERPYFFVMVPNDSPAREFRDITGALNAGSRAPDQPPTIGELVLTYYGMIAPPAPDGAAPVHVVRSPPGSTVLQELEAGTVAAATRTQFLHGDLVDNILNTGHYRLLPIRDHEALARALPGAEAGFIPAGAYGVMRRVPADPTPTLVFSSFLVARRELPGRVARDILDVIYDPRFARDIQHELTEENGRKTGALPLHRAADLYYHRNDLVTADRLGRLSFVASVIAGTFATVQFVLLLRRNERRRARRRLLAGELDKLTRLRDVIESADTDVAARSAMAEADALLSEAELEVAEDRLDAEAIQALRSLHGVCGRALARRTVQRDRPATIS